MRYGLVSKPPVFGHAVNESGREMIDHQRADAMLNNLRSSPQRYGFLVGDIRILTEKGEVAERDPDLVQAQQQARLLPRGSDDEAVRAVRKHDFIERRMDHSLREELSAIFRDDNGNS